MFVFWAVKEAPGLKYHWQNIKDNAGISSCYIILVYAAKP